MTVSRERSKMKINTGARMSKNSLNTKEEMLLGPSALDLHFSNAYATSYNVLAAGWLFFRCALYEYRPNYLIQRQESFFERTNIFFIFPCHAKYRQQDCVTEIESKK